MKTNTIKVITASVAAGILAGFGATKVSGDSIIGIAVTVSYLAVVAVIAIAASDYRSSAKPYFASALVTSHFGRSLPASVALRTPASKARLAA